MSRDARPDPQPPRRRVEREPASAPRPETELTASDTLIQSLSVEPEALGEAELIVLADPEAKMVGARYRLPKGVSVTIGRGDTADFRLLGSPAVSRHHATVRFERGAVWIEDASSRNGTFVNGSRIDDAVELRSGDRIQLGGVHCKLLRELDVEAAYHATLLELASRDGLTGAFNRRSFDEELEREMARSRRGGEPLALVLLDVDRFKSINDTHGHVVGDQVLRELVAVARGSLRAEQVLARVGGEEFAILCPATRGVDAASLAERLRAALAGHLLLCLGGAHSLTCSFGVAELAGDGESGAELYARADRALYRAKAGGRNRVTLDVPEP